jgi:hypothetical protein
MAKVNQVKSFIGSVFWTEEDKTGQILNGQNHTGCRHENNILHNNNGAIETIDVSKLNPTHFINNASLSTNINLLSNYLEKFGLLEKYKTYAITSLEQGDNVEIECKTNDIVAFTLTNKRVGTYFDFVMYDEEQYHNNKLTSLDYRNRRMTGYVHSGDQSFSTYLLHHITSKSDNDRVCALGVVGYRNTKLVDYHQQNPCMVIPDHVNEILYVIPCPLDVLTMGDGTIAILGVVQKSRETLKFTILQKPKTLNCVDTGCINERVKNMIIDAKTEFNDEINSLFPIRLKNDKKDDEKERSFKLPSTLHFIQKGLNIEIDEPCFSFGCGLTFHDTVYVKEIADIVTMSPFGILRGPPVIALQKSYDGSMEFDEVEFLDMLDEKTIVIHIDTSWIESVININDVLINGVIIIHTDAPLKDEPIITFLSNLNISGVSALAGPMSIVLVNIDDKYYWYRGIDAFGAKSMNFGDQVDNSISHYIKESFPSVHYKGDDSIMWRNELSTINEMVLNLKSMSTIEIIDNMEEIKNVFCQLQIIFTTIELNLIVKEIVTFLQKSIESSIVMPTEQFDSTLSLVEISKIIAENKGKRRNIQKEMRPLINYLGSIISLQKSSSKVYDLKQLQRRTTISDNVTKATNMSLTDKLELIENYSSSILFSKINLSAFDRMLIDIGRKTITFPHKNLSTINTDFLQVDFDTTQTLIDSTKGHVTHELYSKNSLCIRVTATDIFMPFIMIDSIVECDDPSKIYWISECNEEKWAMFRILMRNTISSCPKGKSLNLLPQDKLIGHMIANMIICTMENLVSNLVLEGSVNDTIYPLMRGLFGQLLSLLASGATPLSMAWQLVMHKPKIDSPKNDIWIYMKIIQLFPYTGWSNINLNNNIRMLLVKIVRNKVCGLAIDQMLKQMSVKKSNDASAFIESRNIELQHCRLMVDVILHMVSSEKEITDPIFINIVKRMNSILLEDKDKIINSQSSIIRMERFFQKILIGTVYSEDLEQIVRTAINVYTKRSACFDETKQEILDAILLGGDIAQAINMFKAFRTEIREKFTFNEEPKVQNIEAIKSLNQDKIKGDAELRRVAWQVSDHSIEKVKDDNYDKYDKLLNFVLGIEDKPIEQSEDQTIAIKQDTFLQGIPGNKAAIELYESCKQDIVKVINNVTPFVQVQHLLDCIDKPDHHHTLFNMIEIALINYDNVAIIEDRLMSLLY